MRGPSRRLALLMVWWALASRASAGTPASVVAEDVFREIAQSEWVRVLVLLDAPGGEPEQLAKASIADLQKRASKVQDKVLLRLGPGDLRLRRRFEVVPGFAGEVSREGLRRLSTLPEVVRVELDEGGAGSLAEAVPLTNSDQVQALGWTGEGVTVAIIDSGVDTDHPDLAGDLVAEACFCTSCCAGGESSAFGPGSAEDDNGHGTNVAGIVTSDGVVSPVGVAPDAKIVAVKVLSAQNTFCCTSDIIAALNWIMVNRPDVDVVNMSLGTFATYVNNCDTSQAALASTINTLRSRGVLSFCSSGNDALGTRMTAPACIAGAISVGAVWDSNVGPQSFGNCSDPTTAADQVTCFTNTSATTDMFAPGAPITSDFLFGGTATYYGTSMASPHAAGCAADLLEAAPSLSTSTIEYAMEVSGVPVIDVTNGHAYPRVDCLAALTLILIPSGRVPETSLRVIRETSGDLSLTWGPSCGESDNDYEIYEGELGSFASHQPLFCTTMAETFKTLTPGEGSRYYLVVPRNWYREGSYGLRSDGTERPASSGACVARLMADCP